jgi:hypothetical protein
MTTGLSARRSKWCPPSPAARLERLGKERLTRRTGSHTHSWGNGGRKVRPDVLLNQNSTPRCDRGYCIAMTDASLTEYAILGR